VAEPVGLDEGLAEVPAVGLAVALAVTRGCAVGRGDVLLEEGERLQAESASNATATATRPKSTR
jgi:sulfate adenylyltransferase subunit 1 (EFTu-like GTPase family)